MARKVADALGADACFVYLFDEAAGDLVLRATHGTRVEEMTRRPRLARGGNHGRRGERALARDDPVASPSRSSFQDVREPA